MSQRHALRIGAVGAIFGGIMLVVGNILHPREPGQLDNAERLLQVVAGSDFWVPVHMSLLIALALFLGAFYGLTHSITGRWGRAWAGLTWGTAIIGVGLGLTFMLTEVVALPALADTWANSSGVEKDLALAAGSVIFQLSLTLAAGAPLFLFGTAPLLYGVAILGSDDYARWLGWVGVIFGSVITLASVIQLFSGVTTLTGLVVVPIGIFVVTLWVIYLGVLMWMKSAMTAGVG